MKINKKKFINFKHLEDARKIANCNGGYFWHLKLSLKETLFLFVLSFGSLIHAIFPFFLDFTLLEARINRLKHLKTLLPNDPCLKKVNFE